jgi:hypothetical protein
MPINQTLTLKKARMLLARSRVRGGIGKLSLRNPAVGSAKDEARLKAG